MNKFDLTSKIEKFAPLDTQEKWDCSGWLVCTKNIDVKKVMLALTITDNVVNQARANNCDMIISHHPLFCVPIEYSDIDMYCAHTNMDKAQGGTTDTLLDKLGLSSTETTEEFVRIVKLDSPISVEDFADKLKTVSPNLRYINNQNRENIQTIGFCAGSGSDLLPYCEVDAFVTGDLKYHFAVETNTVIYDIGHFESEILILPIFKNILGIDVIFADEKCPFIYKK